jgi:hypothetical protein
MEGREAKTQVRKDKLLTAERSGGLVPLRSETERRIWFLFELSQADE